jgi:hypothetical protein
LGTHCLYLNGFLQSPWNEISEPKLVRCPGNTAGVLFECVVNGTGAELELVKYESPEQWKKFWKKLADGYHDRVVIRVFNVTTEDIQNLKANSQGAQFWYCKNTGPAHFVGGGEKMRMECSE